MTNSLPADEYTHPTAPSKVGSHVGIEAQGGEGLGAIEPRNAFLDAVNRKLRVGRPLASPDKPFSLYEERVETWGFANLNFQTAGCSYDRSGTCTMCDYGQASPRSADDMVAAARAGLQHVDPDPECTVLLSPPGSMFDETEVPPEARRQILQLLADHPCQGALCESRAETITPEVAAEFASILSAKLFKGVEIGLETHDPWVSKYCVNKRMPTGAFERAIRVLRQHDLFSIANVIIGLPFLTERESIEHMLATVAWARAQGTNRCVLFPMHAKPWTLVDWLWRHQLYEPPSLWSIVEVVRRLGREAAKDVTVSWYKTYEEESADGQSVKAYQVTPGCEPTTCPRCLPEAMRLMEAFRGDNRDFGSILRLHDMQCSCKDAWQERLSASSDAPSLPDRVAEAYEVIGTAILGRDWWDRESTALMTRMRLEGPPWLSAGESSS